MALNRRSDGPSPFEVMNGALPGRKPDMPARAPEGESDVPAAPSPLDVWLARAGRPMVLRLPRGYVVLLAVAVVVLLVVAFWMGRSQGFRAAEEEVAQANQQQAVLPPPAPPPSDPPRAAVQAPPAISSPHRVAPAPALPAPTAGPARSATGDPRQVGLNYLVLARYPQKDAQRLIEFLGRYGVEAIAVSADNDSLFHVVELTGFKGTDLRSAAFDQHKRKLQQLGYRWKQQEKGPTDLSDQWLQKYTGR